MKFRKIFAIGDIHGDFNALATILEKMGLIDESGHWNGGKARLVLTGDIMTMPGLPKVPAAETIDIDENDQIVGLF